MNHEKRGPGRPPHAEPHVLMNMRAPADLRRRVRIAAAEEGTTHAGLFALLLDRRDAQIAAERARQVSPLHRPRELRPRPAVAGYT